MKSCEGSKVVGIVCTQEGIVSRQFCGNIILVVLKMMRDMSLKIRSFIGNTTSMTTPRMDFTASSIVILKMKANSGNRLPDSDNTLRYVIFGRSDFWQQSF